MARLDPTKSKEMMENVVKVLAELGIKYLVTIAGDDTAFSASNVYTHAKGSTRAAHVPKTIDNDLTLPGSAPTFGFESARHLGVHISMRAGYS